MRNGFIMDVWQSVNMPLTGVWQYCVEYVRIPVFPNRIFPNLILRVLHILRNWRSPNESLRGSFQCVEWWHNLRYKISRILSQRYLFFSVNFRDIFPNYKFNAQQIFNKYFWNKFSEALRETLKIFNNKSFVSLTALSTFNIYYWRMFNLLFFNYVASRDKFSVKWWMLYRFATVIIMLVFDRKK